MKQIKNIDNQRLEFIISTLENLGIKFHQTEIVKTFGISKGNVSRMFNKQIGVSDSFFETFLKHYNVVFKTNDNQINSPEIIPVGKHIATTNNSDDSWEGLPMYNIPITASFVESYRDDNNYEPQYYLRDPRFKDCNFGAIITGDSMHSEIRHGDFVACKEVLDTRFIVFGDIYYIVTTNGLETCKYINAGKDDEHLMLQAKNEHVSPMQLPKDMLLRLYKVRGIVRGY